MSSKNQKLALLALILLFVSAAYFLSRTPPNQGEKTDNTQNATGTEAGSIECDLASSDLVDVPEGWSTYASSDLCVAFMYPSGWEVSESPSSVGVGERKGSRLESYELFALRLYKSGTDMYELLRQDTLDQDKWKKIGPDVYAQSEEGQGVQVENYLYYAPDGRIYSYQFQIVSSQDNVTVQKIRDSLIIR